jgi:hypothetical protein
MFLKTQIDRRLQGIEAGGKSAEIKKLKPIGIHTPS